FQLVFRLAQRALGTLATCEITADRKSRHAHEGERQTTASPGYRLCERSAAIRLALPLREQGLLGCSHLLDRTADLIERMLAATLHYFPLCPLETLGLPQLDHRLELGDAPVGQPPNDSKPLLLDRVISGQSCETRLCRRRSLQPSLVAPQIFLVVR